MVYYNFRVLLHVFGARWQEESERKKKEQSNRHFPHVLGILALWLGRTPLPQSFRP